MEEYIDILDNSLLPVDSCLKEEVHRKGLLHSSVHLWIFDPFAQQVLLQRRSFNKQTYPGLWDISVAGHISSRELPIEAITREAKEELGIKIEKKALQFMGSHLNCVKHNPLVIDNELNHVFFVKQDKIKMQVIIDQEEVMDCKWVPLSFLSSKEHHREKRELAPHKPGYYDWVYQILKNSV